MDLHFSMTRRARSVAAQVKLDLRDHWHWGDVELLAAPFARRNKISTEEANEMLGSFSQLAPFSWPSVAVALRRPNVTRAAVAKSDVVPSYSCPHCGVRMKWVAWQEDVSRGQRIEPEALVEVCAKCRWWARAIPIG